MYQTQLREISRKLKGTRKARQRSYYISGVKKISGTDTYKEIKSTTQASYRNYLLTLKKAYESFDKKGKEMYDNEILSRQEFFAEYESRRASGEKNITRNIVEQQKYKYSFKQARAWHKALKEHEELRAKEVDFGEDYDYYDEDYIPPTIEDLRSAENLTDYVDPEAIKAYYYEHKEEYIERYGRYEAIDRLRQEIGVHFFGSE